MERILTEALKDDPATSLTDLRKRSDSQALMLSGSIFQRYANRSWRVGTQHARRKSRRRRERFKTCFWKRSMSSPPAAHISGKFSVRFGDHTKWQPVPPRKLLVNSCRD